MNLDQLAKLMDDHVAARAQELLDAEIKKLRGVARETVLKNLDAVIERQIVTRLPALRVQTEQAARNEALVRLRGTDPLDAPLIVDGPLSPDMVKAILDAAVGPFAASTGVRKSGKSWACIACGNKYDNRRAATTHANSCDKRHTLAVDYLNTNGSKNAANGTGNGNALLAKRQSRVVQKKTSAETCIHPRCDEPAQGPRNHYLCEKHKTAPLREIRKWQRQDQASP